MKLAFKKTKISVITLFFWSSLWSATFCMAKSGNDDWQFHIAPYAWLAGQSGTVSSFGNLPPVDIDIDFWDDILGNINGALFVVGEVQKGKFGIMVDIAYVYIEDENATPGPAFSSAVAETNSWLATAAAEYRVVEKSAAFVDLFAGFRYWSVESDLTLNAGTLPKVKIRNDGDWFDPLIGIKGRTGIGETDFFVSCILQLGGFGVGSDLMWDVNVNLGYNWTETFSTTFGYRYLDVDYNDEGFLYDVSQDGPVLGLSWRF